MPSPELPERQGNRARILINAAREEFKRSISPYPPAPDLFVAIFAFGKITGELRALSQKAQGINKPDTPTIKQLERDEQIMNEYLHNAMWR